MVLLAEVKVRLDHLWDIAIAFEFLHFFSELGRHCGNFSLDINSSNVLFVLIVLFAEVSVIPVLPVRVLSELLCNFLFVLIRNRVSALVIRKCYPCAHSSFPGSGVRGPCTS